MNIKLHNDTLPALKAMVSSNRQNVDAPVLSMTRLSSTESRCKSTGFEEEVL